MAPKTKKKSGKIKESLRYKVYQQLKSRFLDNLSLEPLKDIFLKPELDIRPATHADVPKLRRLITPHTKEMFGRCDLHYIIEIGVHNFCLTTKLGRILAFISFLNYPNLPVLPPWKWKPWIEYYFRLEACDASNTVFIQMILWHDKLKNEHFIGSLLKYLYVCDVTLKYVILIVPPEVQTFSFITTDIFTCLLPNHTHGATHDKVQKLYINMRSKVVSKLKIRRTVEEDNIDIMPLLDRTAPKLRKIYGDYLVSELVRFSSDTRDGLTGLLNNKAVGFLLLNKNVCYATINEYFEVVMYNGFCKKHCDDYVPEKRFTGIIEEINIDVPNDILDVEEKIADEVKEHGQEHADSVGSDTDEVESLESEDVSYLADLDDDERFGYTFPPVVCPGANFQTHSKSRLSCVNLESSEIALKSKLVAHARGPRRDSIPIKYGFPLPIKYNDLYVGADFLGEGNAVIIEMFVLEDSANTSFCFDFLEAVFEAASDKEYCIICAPSNLPTPPFINLFTKVCPKVGKLFPQELYFLHRNVLLGQLRVREAFRGDESAILQLISGLEKSRTILMDFIDSVVSSTSDLKSYVLLSEDVVTGICIISVTGFDIRLLEGQFDIDKHLTSALHSQYAYIKHAFICPNLSVRGKFFFREVLRFSSNTVLFYTLFEEELYKSEEVQLTVPNIIESLTPVAPRQQLQYPPEIERKESSIFTADGREIRVQIEDNMATIREVQEFEKEPPFALYFTTIKKLPFSSSHKKIVIVGGSETAISFLETLIFRSAGNVKYTNVMLVSPHGFPYNQKPHKAADLMCVYTGRYNHRFMTQLGLRTYINVVYGYMTAINREEKTIVIDYDKTLPYDYLFLFCGVQCSKPLPHNVQKDRQKPLYHYNSRYVQNYLDEYPANLFLIKSVVDARYALLVLHDLMQNIHNPEAKIIVYGHSLLALTIIHSLMEYKVDPKKIAFVEPFPSDPAVTLFNNVEIDDAVIENITAAGIDVYKQCHFNKWESCKRENSIKKVTFEALTQTIILECLCLFACNKKFVDPRTFFAIVNAKLVYDGGLIIDKNFRTNDKYIYGAGPLTKYKRRYFAGHLDHHLFNSAEVGRMAFTKVVDILSPNYIEEAEDKTEPDDDKVCAADLPELTKPMIRYCSLPGGWHYLHVVKPGVPMPLECQLSNTSGLGHEYVTGNCENVEGKGYFRIQFNDFDEVSEIMCYTGQDIEVNNLIKLYGKSGKLLNNIHERFNQNLISDLYQYFRQSWACAIYHDRFEDLEQKNIELFYKPNKNENCSPFIETITDVLEENAYKPINEDERQFLQNEYNKTGIKERIHLALKHYLLKSKFHLPMYVLDDVLNLKLDKLKEHYLHSKPLMGVTREILLAMKTEEVDFEDEEVDDLFEGLEDYIEGLENSDQYKKLKELMVQAEKLKNTREKELETIVQSEPQKPPQSTATMTENKQGFCVMSCMALHTNENRCQHCNKIFLSQHDKKHSFIHKCIGEVSGDDGGNNDDYDDDDKDEEKVQQKEGTVSDCYKVIKKELSDQNRCEIEQMHAADLEVNENISISSSERHSRDTVNETVEFEVLEIKNPPAVHQLEKSQLPKLNKEIRSNDYYKIKEMQVKRINECLKNSWLKYYFE